MADRPDSVALSSPAAPWVSVAARSYVKELWLVPYLNPILWNSPVAPDHEPCRVAPAELTAVAAPLDTVAVAVRPPEVPPPDGSQILRL